MKKVAMIVMLLVGFQLVASPCISDATFAEIMLIADRLGVPRSVAAQLIFEESRGKPTARSSIAVRGYYSRGLVQLWEYPPNLNELLNKFWYPYEGEWIQFDILNPIHNAKVGLRYLAALHRQYGNWTQALWFYNSGNPYNPPEDTKAYALRIVSAPERQHLLVE